MIARLRGRVAEAPPPADNRQLVATPAAFDAVAAARARRGPRASAPIKDHRGAAKAPAFRRRRAPTGWAALPIDAVGARRRPHHRERASERDADDAHAVDDAVVDAAPRFRH